MYMYENETAVCLYLYLDFHVAVCVRITKACVHVCVCGIT